MGENMNVTNLEYVYDDGEVIYMFDGKEYYGINYHNIDKTELREYSNIEPTEVEKDEDGGLSYYYDDDSWEVEFEMVEEYIKDCIKYNCGVSESGDSIGALQGGIFKVVEGDNGWYESLMIHLKK
jgi:hypothetical protein|tara:strand:+ start:1487 stop:1861 length:375 start_codon:yes stop_codon:yes gene_type:complete